MRLGIGDPRLGMKEFFSVALAHQFPVRCKHRPGPARCSEYKNACVKFLLDSSVGVQVHVFELHSWSVASL
jgi:hypothetical protein